MSMAKDQQRTSYAVPLTFKAYECVRARHCALLCASSTMEGDTPGAGSCQSLTLPSCAQGSLTSPEQSLNLTLTFKDTAFNCIRMHQRTGPSTSSARAACILAPAFGSVRTILPVLSAGPGTPLQAV